MTDSPLFVTIFANLPLPVIFYLNIRVTLKYLKVKRLTRHIKAAKPERLVVGWWVNNAAMVFVYVPMISERRIFVQNHWWLLSYMVAATLSITGLTLMNSGLGEELHALARRRRRRRSR